MDLGTARDEVYLRLGMEQSDGQLTPQTVTALLRTALNYLASEHDWAWLQSSETLTTTLGVNYVTPLAGSAAGVTWTRTTNLSGAAHGHYLTQIPWQEFRNRDVTNQSALPDVWSEHLGLLYLHPTPSGSTATLYHDFIRGEATLSSDTDSPLLIDQFSGAWVEKAAELCARRIQDYPTAQVCSGEYQKWLKSMSDYRRRSAGPYRVAVRPGNWV